MQQSDRAGLLYALAGFCTLSIGDAIIKGMAGDWPAPAMALTRYVVGTVLLGVMLARAEGFGALALPKDKLQWVRGVAISCSAIGMFLAVWIMPLAEATTIAFTQPMITAVLAAFLLGERARASTWIATFAAFVGVFIVLRPNFETAGWGVLFPLIGATGMAVTIIANRASHGRASVLALQYYMSVTAMIFLCFATAAGHFSGVEGFALDWPHWSVVARCAFIGFSATLAQYLIYMGTARAGAGTIAPMTYGQLLMAVGLGWIFFGDAPDALAMLGAAIIIGAGLYLWYAARQRAGAAKP
ncbi:DMT family transporter [Alteraurantiacibacter aquimixticola]|uniref:DMT family transporter n=1 Tax=Alteraurantiacibacter aquimixticola TaxID=2489173 RepID=A0A4T3F5S5_9SPHN|nr:DMT family transporter [Alteraurantiacibacter aquimixticola]TIX51839.1 DMT family transporter [Alteraurantiacibacter aquimixticola]